jgi:NitT/TauT family transport system permease protein
MKKYIGVIITLVVFVLAWHGVSLLVNMHFLQSPVATFAALARLASTGKLWPHLWASFSRVMWALIASSIPALLLGLAAGRSARLNSIISPAIYLFHPTPKAAFLPIIMLFFGIGDLARIALITFIIFGQMLVTVRDAARQIPEEYLDAVRSLGAGRMALLRHVVIPAVMPGFFTGFRISLGTAVAVLFIAETFVSQNGLGHLINDAWIRIDYAEMYAAIFALSILGLLLFALTDLLEFIFCPWQDRKTL